MTTVLPCESQLLKSLPKVPLLHLTAPCLWEMQSGPRSRRIWETIRRFCNYASSGEILALSGTITVSFQMGTLQPQN